MFSRWYFKVGEVIGVAVACGLILRHANERKRRGSTRRGSARDGVGVDYPGHLLSRLLDTSTLSGLCPCSRYDTTVCVRPVSQLVTFKKVFSSSNPVVVCFLQTTNMIDTLAIITSTEFRLLA